MCVHCAAAQARRVVGVGAGPRGVALLRPLSLASIGHAALLKKPSAFSLQHGNTSKLGSTGAGKHLPHPSTSTTDDLAWIHGRLRGKEGWVHGRGDASSPSRECAGSRSSGRCPICQRMGGHHTLRLVPLLRRLGGCHLRTVHVLSADGRGGGGRRGERPRHRDHVLRRTTGARGGAGHAAPVPPRLGPLCLRLPRPRAHHRRPLDVLRPRQPLPQRRPRTRRLLLQYLLHRRRRPVRCGRYPLLRGPPPGSPPGR